ncbi:hypothetical protein CCU68_31375 [Pseudomonas gingeri NCPPB 3146 = LMG 5327]|uniref:RING-type E3 ubiquitin transferase n=2 Tax=Pseudomonas gingeri TaxID=117681 RepID=A0A7Y7XZD9_9PSED|nr:NEL-type E3 ubiquitin ligase domain-containing protein [Pseudomonas gingeri]NWC15135.1 hypothetical protein [Pseudomonas gingeri]PNQ88511.1 hypothetical protein CCU68_31375 [Pseudomonas gingeri NCPPB 3146 = LMG 5327]
MSQTVEHSIDTGDEPPPPVPTEADEPLLSAFLQRDAGLLHSEKSWTQQQVVEQLAVSFKAAMGPLHETEQRTWLGHYRQFMAARSVLDEESRTVVDAFETAGVARLRARLKEVSGLDLDPHTTYLHTVIDLPAQVQQPLAEGPPVQVESFERRIGTVTVSTMTLWQAACLNFAFSDSSYANLKRRWISRERKVDINDRRWLLATEAFVRIVRELDLGAVLKPHVEQAMRVDGPLDRSILAFAQAEIHFGLYDSARQPAATGLTYHAFTALRDELSMTHPRLKGSYVALRLPGGLMAGLDRVMDTIESKLLHLFAINYEPLEAIYLPLLIFEIVGRAGLYSYCVDRPGGALRFHDSRAAFERDFKAQLQADSAGQRLRWLIPSLAFKQQHQFWQWIKAHSKPKGITWFSTFADVYEWLWPEDGIQDLTFEYGPTTTGFSPGKALAAFYAWRYRLNTQAIAVAKSEHDMQAVKDGFLAAMHLLLNVLMLPVPGGFGILGKAVASLMLAQLGLELVDGIVATFQGRPKALGQALADVGTAILIGGALGYAGHVVTQRFQALSLELGRWRKVASTEAVTPLWKVDLSSYAVSTKGLMERFAADERGLFEEEGRVYGEVREQGRSIPVRLEYDAALKRYVAVAADPTGFRPPMRYDWEARRWVPDLDDSHTLSDARWLERMMLQGTAGEGKAEIVLSTSGVRREALQTVWSGGLPSASLAEAVRRRQVDAGLDTLIASSDARLGLPADAERALFCLLPRLADWPETTGLFVHGPDGELLELHGRQERPGDFAHKVAVRRLEDGGYVVQPPEPNQTPAVLAHEDGVQSLILGLLPDGCPLKGDFQPFVRRQWNRAIRQQLIALARLERHSLFEILSTQDGLRRSISLAPARHYLSLVAPVLPPQVLKLQALYPGLSLSRIAEYLRRMPLESRQRQRLLEHGELPGEHLRGLADAEAITRLGRALDGIHQARASSRDTDAWLQLAAELLVEEQLGSTLYPRVRSSPTHAGFFLALATLFKQPEVGRLGVAVVTDVQALRKLVVAGLEKRRAEDGRIRLPVERCQETLTLPSSLKADEAGCYQHEGNTYLPLEGRLYRIENTGLPEDWRINPSDLPGAYTPRLENNGASAWWHEFEEPLKWDGLTAFRRLGGQAGSFSEAIARQILSVSGTSDSLLRQAIFCNQRPPAFLVAVMRDFRDHLDIESHVTSLTSRSEAVPALLEMALDAVTDADHQWLSIAPELSGKSLVDALLQRLENDPRRARQVLVDGLSRQRGKLVEPLADVLEQAFPRLPAGVAEEMLEHSQAWQRTLITQTGRIPLALAEEARWWSEEATLGRALMGLSPDALGNARSDQVLLSVLKQLPGWPGQVRIEIRQAAIDGPLLDSSGSTGAGKRRVVVKVPDGYEAFIVDGEQVSPRGALQSDLLLALSRLVRDLPARLPWGGTRGPGAELKALVQQQAIRQRAELRQRLGLRPVHAWTALPKRLVRQRDGRIGIALSGRGPGLPTVGLFDRLRRLYRGAAHQELFDVLQSFGTTSVQQRAAVEALEQDYIRLKSELAIWADVPPIEGGGHLLARRIRQAMASRIRRCWRWESRNVLGGVLLLEGFTVEQMPMLNVNFKHVTQLLVRDMNLDIGYMNAFLRAFPALRHLHLSAAHLKRLPPEVAGLQALEELDLQDNHIVLTAPDALQLSGLRQLKYVNLQGNPLNLLPDFAGLSHLQMLNLSRTGIDTWPSGVLLLKHLISLDLTHNRIQQVPDAVLLSPLSLNRGVNLGGNPLLPDTVAKLSVYIRERKGAGITFGLTLDERSAPVGIEAWGTAAERTEGQNACWQRVRDDLDSEEFFDYLESLSALATFFDPQFSGARGNLTRRVWRMITAAADSEFLCEQLFVLQLESLAEGMRRLDIFNELEFAVLCHQAFDEADEASAKARLLSLLKGKFRLRVLRDEAADPVIYRECREQLAACLELPDLFNEPFYKERVQLDSAEIETMVERVRQLEATPQANGLQHYLRSAPPWRRFLELAYERELESLSVQARESWIDAATTTALGAPVV